MSLCNDAPTLHHAPSGAPSTVLRGGFGSLPGWAGYHLFYHEDRDRLLDQLVRPLLLQLWQQGLIGRAFFGRSSLGGPHVRLWVEVTGPHAQRQGCELLRRAVDRFFDRCPSLAPPLAEDVLRQHHAALGSGPHEVDDRLYPDNHLLERPFVPEIERYGGRDLLGLSLDLCTVSSLAVLDLLRAGEGKNDGGAAALDLRFLLQQAVGAARSVEELHDLLDYPARLWAHLPLAAVSAAEEAYRRQGERIRALVREGIEAGAAEVPPLVQEGARLLSRIHARRVPRSRERIAMYHLSANRLGWAPLQEVHGVALLRRAVADLLRQEPAWCARSARELAVRQEAPAADPSLGRRLAALVHEGFAARLAEPMAAAAGR